MRSCKKDWASGDVERTRFPRVGAFHHMEVDPRRFHTRMAQPRPSTPIKTASVRTRTPTTITMATRMRTKSPFTMRFFLSHGHVPWSCWQAPRESRAKAQRRKGWVPQFILLFLRPGGFARNILLPKVMRFRLSRCMMPARVVAKK